MHAHLRVARPDPTRHRPAASSRATVARAPACALALAVAAPAFAAPNDERLGRSHGYPVSKAGNDNGGYCDEIVRVGSFTHRAEIPGPFRGKVNSLERAAHPLPRRKSGAEPAYRWSIDREQDLSVDDFVARRRIIRRPASAPRSGAA
jgi:hypothetical protein